MQIPPDRKYRWRLELRYHRTKALAEFGYKIEEEQLRRVWMHARHNRRVRNSDLSRIHGLMVGNSAPLPLDFQPGVGHQLFEMPRFGLG